MANIPFHLVTISPWPIILSINIMNMFLSMSMFLSKYSFYTLFINIILFMMISMQWWRDVTRESTFQGFHTKFVYKGLRMGMILFITSELFFFISFFWTYFDLLLSPSMELGINFPPLNIMPFNPFNIPLLNTIILLSSGISITWSHHSMLNNKYFNSIYSLILTIYMGIYFTLLQLFEYMEAPFSMTDSMYGSIFFMATGFHGMHVIIGTLFLIICLIRMMWKQFSKIHHFGYEAAIWYWHFVDVIWLFLYMMMYWWPS